MRLCLGFIGVPYLLLLFFCSLKTHRCMHTEVALHERQVPNQKTTKTTKQGKQPATLSGALRAPPHDRAKGAPRCRESAFPHYCTTCEACVGLSPLRHERGRKGRRNHQACNGVLGPPPRCAPVASCVQVHTPTQCQVVVVMIPAVAVLVAASLGIASSLLQVGGMDW